MDIGTVITVLLIGVIVVLAAPECKYAWDFLRWGFFRGDYEGVPAQEARTRWQRAAEIVVAFVIFLSCWVTGRGKKE